YGRIGNHFGAEVVEADPTQLTIFQVVGEQLVDRSADARRRHIRFKTTAFATVAKATCRVDTGVADFTCNAMLAVEKLPVGYKSASQACTERDDDKVAHAFGGTVDHFTDGSGVGIVGNDGGDVELLFEHVGQRDDAFPGQIGRTFDRPFVVVAVGCTDANAEDFVIDFHLADAFAQRS